ncbi:alpha/beta fold hydrolase [Aureimonas phyllosphaerae]|uniref:alpha/beta fold hydrolase n=1 Tax=Aureimonas phyllosphaerae TaxID=1166078 RepID=UPI003A5C755F
MRTPDDLIHFERSGTGSTLVLIHGVGASLRSWDEVCALLEADHDVLRLDLRGHGQSAPIDGPYSIEAFARDVVAVMDAASVAKADLVGFSLGGLIAQKLALEYPERFGRVVLLSAVAGRTPVERERVLERLDMIRTGGMRAVTGAARERWFTPEFAARHPEIVERRIEEMHAAHVPSYLEAYRVFGTTELVDELAGIRHPTLIMTGELDPGSNTRMAETMHRLIPDAQLRILPGLRHSVLTEASELVAEHVRNFLATDRTPT